MSSRYAGFGSRFGADQDSGEDFVMIGTHFDPAEPTNSTSILATMGRKASKLVDLSSSTYGYDGKRFHGAFTGGFNAGFYNTVGSVEGWRPSEFKSSKEERALKRNYEPEDFMDKGDFSEHGINPKQIKIRNTFDHNDSLTRHSGKASNQRSNDEILREMIRVKSLSIGKRILISMGWKPGEGVGVKMPRKHRRLLKSSLVQETVDEHTPSTEPAVSTGVKVYGVSLPPASYQKTSRLDDDDDDDDDDQLYANVNLPPLDYEVHFQLQKQEHHGIGYKSLESSNLFGHENLFTQPSVEKQISHVKIRGQAFGVGIEEDEDDRDLFAIDDLKQYDYELTSTNDKATDIMRRKTDQNNFVLKFVRYESNVIPVVYPPPLVPPDFRIGHRFPKSQMAAPPVKPKENEPTPTPSIKHDANTRGILLGDLSFLSRPPPTVSTVPSLPVTPTPPVTVLEPSKTTKAAPDSSSLEWDMEKERTSQLPAASGANNSARSQFLDAVKNRFTTPGDAIQLTDRQTFEAALEADLRKAVSLKMYGALTRSTRDWKPNPLLCKRMNIPNPYPDDAYEDTKESKKSRRQLCSNLFEHLFTQSSVESTPAKSEILSTSTGTVESSMETVVSTMAPPQTPSQRIVEAPIEEPVEQEIPQRPPLDFFSAIFESQDSDDNDDDNNGEAPALNEPLAIAGPKNPLTAALIQPIVSVPIKSSAQHILLSSESEDSNSSDSSIEEIPNPKETSLPYGPEIPTLIPRRSTSEKFFSVHEKSSDTNVEYVELKSKKKHKKKKKKHHKKSKKHHHD